MEMVLNNGFCEMTQDQMYSIDGGADGWYIAGEIIGGALGVVWDIAVVARALYTGSWV